MLSNWSYSTPVLKLTELQLSLLSGIIGNGFGLLYCSCFLRYGSSFGCYGKDANDSDFFAIGDAVLSCLTVFET